MVCCDPAGDERFEEAPCLVVEVLSPSTASVDRREKLVAYKALPSLQVYVIADPDQPMLEVHRRRRDDDWTIQVLGHGGELQVPGPPVTLAIDDLYDGVA